MSDSIQWSDVNTLTVEGRGFDDVENFYDRLPARAQGSVPDPVWNLSRDSAGICARFNSDATALHARWTLRKKRLAMEHTPATGVSGLDLYVRLENAWRWLAVGQPTGQTNSCMQCINASVWALMAMTGTAWTDGRTDTETALCHATS